jgi:hypothetical protein
MRTFERMATGVFAEAYVTALVLNAERVGPLIAATNRRIHRWIVDQSIKQMRARSARIHGRGGPRWVRWSL